MILLDFKISENSVIIGICENHNNGFAGSLLFSPQNPSKNGDTNTFPKQKICPMECTGNCATFLRSCYHQRLPLLMQIAALGGDVERVLQFAHGKLLGFLLRFWKIELDIRNNYLDYIFNPIEGKTQL